ncbi:DUF2459 domain-containing protein [Litoribrevibacter euphylliae]|uniref:DUF2459 domain-containing protein n=1 Tax=Litoribrevibacter euphylliae TaxID=1834034 RepID=A0ABV7HH00_9GAMM
MKDRYRNSQFYKGVDDYYGMNTCNKWTANAIEEYGNGHVTDVQIDC